MYGKQRNSASSGTSEYYLGREEKVYAGKGPLFWHWYYCLSYKPWALLEIGSESTENPPSHRGVEQGYRGSHSPQHRYSGAIEDPSAQNRGTAGIQRISQPRKWLSGDTEDPPAQSTCWEGIQRTSQAQSRSWAVVEQWYRGNRASAQAWDERWSRGPTSRGGLERGGRGSTVPKRDLWGARDLRAQRERMERLKGSKSPKKG